MATAGITGTFANMSKSGREYTPQYIADRIRTNLLQLGTKGTVSVLDPCCGGGNLLSPFAARDGVRLVGIDISRDEVTSSRLRLPNAVVVHSAAEKVTMPLACTSILMNNPPYFAVAGTGRIEYQLTKQFAPMLVAHGVLVLIIPARSALDGMMARMLVRTFEHLQCWRFPDPDFDIFSQIVIVGYKRRRTLTDDEINAHLDEVQEVKSWRYHPAEKTRDAFWGTDYKQQSDPPPVLPEEPIAEPYVVPPSITVPTVTLREPTNETLLEQLTVSGAWVQPTWRDAVTPHINSTVRQPAMPLSGLPHVAAYLMKGMMNGRVLQLGGVSHIMNAYISHKEVAIEVEEEDEKKGILRIKEDQDYFVLRVLNVDTGVVETYEGEAVYSFLQPYLNELAQQMIAELPPTYNLDPADWQLQVAMHIAQDKKLPGMDRAGLADPQLERSFAMYRLVDQLGKAAIQGTPGTGKTRMISLLLALMAYRYHQRDHFFKQPKPGTMGHVYEPTPKWIKRMLKAWRNNPHTTGDAPRALPLAISAPMRTTESVWAKELRDSWDAERLTDELPRLWPGVETMRINDWMDVDAWMQRCAVSDAPAVVAVFSHSLSRAFGNAWRPAVTEKREKFFEEDARGKREPDPTTPTGYTGKWVERTYYYCQACGEKVRGAPRNKKIKNKEGEAVAAEELAIDGVKIDEDVFEPVMSEDGVMPPWFTQKQRLCINWIVRVDPATGLELERRRCGAQLWQMDRTEKRRKKYPPLPFDAWSIAAPKAQPAVHYLPKDKIARLPHHERKGYVPSPKAEKVRITSAKGERGPRPPVSFSPYEYARRKYRGLCAAFVMDESHNARNEGTDIRQAMHDGFLFSQTCVIASGTHYSGMFTDFFPYWFTFAPETFLAEGYGWRDLEKAARKYGITQTVTVEVESKANRGTGNVYEKENIRLAPGVSTRIIPNLLELMICIDVLDVGALMPPKEELPVLVDMHDEWIDEQRAIYDRFLLSARNVYSVSKAHFEDVRSAEHFNGIELAAASDREKRDKEFVDWVDHITAKWHRQLDRIDIRRMYAQVSGDLEALSMDRIAAATLQKGTLPGLWAIMGMHETPYTVTTKQRNDWGTVIGERQIFKAPRLDPKHIYPLERKLQEIIRKELAEERIVQIYVDQSITRSTAERLTFVLEGLIDPAHLYIMPDSVDVDEREDALRAAVEAGARVCIVGYLKVQEGLNLQFIDTTVWFELAKNAQTLEQASLRNWRLGATKLKRIYYMAYRNTVGHAKLQRLGKKFGASLLFRGELVESALAKTAGVDKTMLARLAGNMGLAQEQALLDAKFAERNAALAEQLKRGRTFFGAQSTIAERLNAVQIMQALPHFRPAEEQGKADRELPLFLPIDHQKLGQELADMKRELDGELPLRPVREPRAYEPRPKPTDERYARLAQRLLGRWVLVTALNVGDPDGKGIVVDFDGTTIDVELDDQPGIIITFQAAGVMRDEAERPRPAPHVLAYRERIKGEQPAPKTFKESKAQADARKLTKAIERQQNPAPKVEPVVEHAAPVQQLPLF